MPRTVPPRRCKRRSPTKSLPEIKAEIAAMKSALKTLDGIDEALLDLLNDLDDRLPGIVVTRHSIH